MHYTEEDYCHDAELLVSLLCRLHEHSQQPLLPSLHSLEPWQLLDSRLIGKWQDVLVALAPPTTTRYVKTECPLSLGMTLNVFLLQVNNETQHINNGYINLLLHEKL